MDDGDGAALCRLGGDVAHEAAVVGAGEAAVGDEGGAGGKAAAIEELHGLVHLPHAGTALGALVADDHHVAGPDLAGQDGLLGGLLRVEADGLALKVVEALVKGAGLGDAGVGGQVAPQHGHAAGIAEGIADGVDDVVGQGIEVAVGRQRLLQGLAGDGEDAGVQPIAQLLHDPGHGAVPVEVDHVVLVGGGEDLGDLGRDAGELVKLLHHVDAQLGLVGDGGQVHDGVGGAGHGQADLDGVADGLVGDDLPGADPLADQLHDPHAGLLGQGHAAAGGGGSGGAGGDGHAHGLREGAHGVGGAEIRAGAAGWAGGVLHGGVGLLGHPAGGEHAVSLGEGALVRLVAVELAAALHGAAGQQDAGDVQTGGSHQHAGDDLVAGAQQHQAVKEVDLGHGLHGAGDQLPGGQDVVHADLALGDAVAAAHHAELHRRAAGPVDAGLDLLRHLAQVIVAGNALAPGVGDADEGTVLHVVRGKAHGLVGRSVVLVFGTL